MSIDYSLAVSREMFSTFLALDLIELPMLGYLHFAYMVLASLGNIRKLIDMCNSRCSPSWDFIPVVAILGGAAG